MPSRRQFLKYGVAGALALAAAGIARGQPADRAYRAASGDDPLTVLGGEDRTVLAAIAPALLAGVGGALERVDAVVGSVDRAVAGLPPHLQREVLQLLGLLGSWAGRRWLAGVASPWPRASREDVAAFLERWRFSRWALLQQGYQALHDLVLAAWYARPDGWPAIGYPGPPEVQ
jgi:hypothetical protein